MKIDLEYLFYKHEGKILIFLVLVVILSAGIIVNKCIKTENKFKEECEAKGGSVIRGYSNIYCVDRKVFIK